MNMVTSFPTVSFPQAHQQDVKLLNVHYCCATVIIMVEMPVAPHNGFVEKPAKIQQPRRGRSRQFGQKLPSGH
jgi:hypothetical protein